MAIMPTTQLASSGWGKTLPPGSIGGILSSNTLSMNKKILRPLFVLSLTISVFNSPANESADDLPLLPVKVKTVAAFKNGLAFVLKAGETPLKDGWARMEQLPPAALGSLWIGTTSKSGPVTDVIAYKEKVAEDADAISLNELLAANVGHRVVLTYAHGTTTKSAEGTLLAVPADRKPDANVLTPLSPSPYGFGAYRPPGTETTRGEIVLLRTTAADGHSSLLALAKTSVLSLEILDEANVRTSVEQELARTKIHVGGNPAHAEITVAGLEKGIVWSPSYRINIADEKLADIELDAVFANDMEDLDNADVSFVVGYPNFSFADVLSPISLQQNVAGFVQALAAGGGAQAGRFANVMSQSVMYNSARFDTSGSLETGYSAGQPLPGEQGEDLYFYHKNGVTLKKGDRASFSVLKTSAPYEHIYQWEIPDSMNVDDRGYRLNSQNKPENLVWHVLRLENKSQQPWTTAPAFALNGALPVAQDTLGYTPPGGRSFLKLTVATDVRVEQTQIETARKPVRIADRNYDEVTVAGTLKLTNWKNKEIAMLIRKSVVGEVLEAPAGNVAKVARNLTAVNPGSEIEWEFKLPAGKDRELTYQYKVLLSR